MEKLCYSALYALADMVNQFAYDTTFKYEGAVGDFGLSALEDAFSVLEDAGCKRNSNGTIMIGDLWAFMKDIKAKMDKQEVEQ